MSGRSSYISRQGEYGGIKLAYIMWTPAAKNALYLAGRASDRNLRVYEGTSAHGLERLAAKGYSLEPLEYFPSRLKVFPIVSENVIHYALA